MTAPEEMADAANAIRAAVELSPELFHGEPPDLDLDLKGAAAHEGRILQRLHLIRERNPKLRAKKIAQSRKQRGKVSCEACEFDFEATYGHHGRDYIECHHATPLSHSGPTVTKLDNLVLALFQLPSDDPPQNAVAIGGGAASPGCRTQRPRDLNQVTGSLGVAGEGFEPP